MRRRTMTLGLTALLLCGAVLAWWLAHRDLAFDSSVWKSAKRPEFEPRYRMVRDIQRMVREGQIHSTETARQALGARDAGWERNWMYNLGPEHRGLFRIDNDWLRLDFAEDGRIERCWMAPD